MCESILFVQEKSTNGGAMVSIPGLGILFKVLQACRVFFRPDMDTDVESWSSFPPCVGTGVFWTWRAAQVAPELWNNIYSAQEQLQRLLLESKRGKVGHEPLVHKPQRTGCKISVALMGDTGTRRGRWQAVQGNFNPFFTLHPNLGIYIQGKHFGILKKVLFSFKMSTTQWLTVLF